MWQTPELLGAPYVAAHIVDSDVVAGVKDDECSNVSLTVLQGLVKIFPLVPGQTLLSLMSTLTLEVRTYFESSTVV